MVAGILVIGGGIIGLAIALELQRRGATVTVLSHNFAQAATQAAAGMLAPQAEEIPPGALRDLCLRSLTLYGPWVDKLEAMTGLETDYWPCGILAPRYCQPPGELGAEWLDGAALHHHQPGLSEAVIGGYWFPEDGQVDSRALGRVLRVAAEEAGVTILEGTQGHGLVTDGDRILAVQTAEGDRQAEHYILATGAWSQKLLPIPVYPKKGQMLSVRVPLPEPDGDPATLPIQQVLFGEHIYIVPRRHGRIVLGATSEWVGFTPHNTPLGLQTLLQGAMQLYPAIQDFPVEECWWGFRPATPDDAPILGPSPYRNLTLATGHGRNGILLAPVTAQVIADWVWQQQADPLWEHFRYDRFTLESHTPRPLGF